MTDPGQEMTKADLPSRGARLVWMAAGCPQPMETDGTPIAPRPPEKLSVLGAGGDPRCASCGEPASNRLDDAISDNFTTVKNRSRAWPHGGRLICQACLWCCKTLALRCALWFARLPDEHGFGGVWFIPSRPFAGWQPAVMPSGGVKTLGRPDVLSALLAPPPAPFVAGLPLAGIDHGGEAHIHRTLWPWTGPGAPGRGQLVQGVMVPENVLVKLQAKHVALYADISHDRMRYRLQVDDAADVTVDVALWTELRAIAEPLLVELRQHGVGAMEARAALISLRPPLSAPISIAGPRPWRERTAGLQAHAGAAWWPLFIELIPMPELVQKERTAR